MNCPICGFSGYVDVHVFKDHDVSHCSVCNWSEPASKCPAGICVYSMRKQLGGMGKRMSEDTYPSWAPCDFCGRKPSHHNDFCGMTFASGIRCAWGQFKRWMFRYVD